MKKNLEKLPNACEMIDQLNGYYYYWKKGKDKSRQVGVIAQEVEKVLPEIVHTQPDGIKTVDYPKLTSVLIEAVKTIWHRISDSDQKILAVETKLNEKDQQIADLKLQNEALNAKLEHLDEEVSLIKVAQTKQLVSKMRSIDRSIASEK